VVEDNNLAVQISALRRVLDRDREGSCIQTVPGRGDRFVAPVTRRDPDVVTADVPQSNNGDEIAAAGERPQAPGRPDEWVAFGLLTRRFPCRAGAALLVSVLVVLGAVLAAWNWRPHSSGEARPAPRLSIVVLPFTNLGGSPERQYFADGVTEDLTTDLSRIADMVVISADTAFAFRSRAMDVRNIGRELGVRYVLEGSVQRSGQQIRVNVQLIDAETDTHLWADRFDREASDLLFVQDEITSRIAHSLGVELIGREAAQPAQNPDVLDYIVRARAAINEPRTPERYVKAIWLLERALALDPASVEAKSRLAIAHIGRVLDEMSASVAADIAVAEQLIGQALAASPRSPLSHFAKAKLLRAKHRCENGI
jgi:TolB-like protein